MSNELGQILDKMTQPSVKQRYQSVAEILQVLQPEASSSVTPQPAKQGFFSRLFSQPAQPLRTSVSTSSNSLILDCGNGVKLELVKVAAGTFNMGSNDCDSEQPIHRVNLREFLIGKYPVTQAQYQAVMGSNPSYFKGDENCPVESVSWHDAVRFCEELSKKIGQKVNLPTEAQWEYACRAGSTGIYCFGDDVNQLGNYAWHANNSGDKALDALQIWDADKDNYLKRIDDNKCKTHPVGEKLANPWGVHDMHGNVWEWCEDAWHENYNGVPVDGSAWLTGGDKDGRALRGGSWDFFAISCRSANRWRYDADSMSKLVGFRVVV